MTEFVPLEPVDYLAIGHVAVDLTSDGLRLGGTVSYAALVARALGLRVGIVTSFGDGAPLEALKGIPLVSVPSAQSTTFENIPLPEGRKQILHGRAEPLAYEHIPTVWRTAPIIHLAPLAQEFSGELASQVSAPIVGLTLQGWLRGWDEQGRVYPVPLSAPEEVLPRVGAMVMSIEDAGGHYEEVDYFAHHTRLLAVTEGAAGSVLYWNGDRRRFRALKVREVDSVGAGDIYAAAFFVRLYTTRDPWEAARFATLVASYSVTRPGLEGVPTQEEIQACMMEVLF